jgi:hypothetical protein
MNWIPVTERLPDVNQPVFVSDGVQSAKGCRNDWSTCNPWSASTDGIEVTAIEGHGASIYLSFTPTHWIPIPPLPGEKERVMAALQKYHEAQILGHSLREEAIAKVREGIACFASLDLALKNAEGAIQLCTTSDLVAANFYEVVRSEVRAMMSGEQA